MQFKSSYIIAIIVIVIIIAAATIYLTTRPTPTTTTPTPTAPKVWRWATSDPGSAGYAAHPWIVKVVAEYMPQYTHIILPTSSVVAAIKLFAKGDAEIGYGGNEFSMYQFYTFTGPFKDFKPEVKKWPALALVFTMGYFHFVTTPEKAREIRSWKDLEGRNVFLGPSGYIVNLAMTFIFNKTGIHVHHVEVSTSMVADALRKGTIDASVMYGGAVLSDWCNNVAVAMRLAVVNLSEDERNMLERLGFTTGAVDAKKFYTYDVGVDKIYALTIYVSDYAWLDIPENDIYTMLKILEAHVDELQHPEFELMRSMGFAKMQYNGVKELVGFGAGALIHPGLAKYLKEKGMWEPAWDQWIAK